MTPGNSYSILPEADFDGFIEWVETSYTSDRWSNIYQRGHSVTVWSGKYPAFPRFQKDLRPHFHEHGLVIGETRRNVPKTIDGEMESVHWISAIPVAMAVAESHDMICGRGACQNLVTDGFSDYCSSCEDVMEVATE